MANFSLLVVILVGVLYVEGLAHKGNLKTKRNMKVRRDILLDELTNWSRSEIEKEELMEMREASIDSDDTDESDEPEESAENEGAVLKVKHKISLSLRKLFTKFINVSF